MTTNRFPWLTGVLLLVGFGLIYWADQQLADIQQVTASLFQFPIGRMILWLGTLILAGTGFGLALAAAFRRVGKARTAALLWGVIPLAVLAYYTLSFAGALTRPIPFRWTRFLFANVTIATSALLVGLFIATWLAPIVLPSGRTRWSSPPAGA